MTKPKTIKTDHGDIMVLRIKLADDEAAPIRERYGLGTDGEFVRMGVIGEQLDATEEGGEKPVMITTDDVDRYGDIVEPKGMQLGLFRKNPVILWAHDYGTPPIGSATWVKKVDHGVLAKPRFASTEFAQTIKGLYDEKHMRAWSIGFIGKEFEVIPDEKNPDKPEWLLGRRFKKTELLEFSAVPVPANPFALSQAMRKGLYVPKTIVSLMGLKLEKDGAREDDPADKVKAPIKYEGADPFKREWIDSDEARGLMCDDLIDKTQVASVMLSKTTYKTQAEARKRAAEAGFAQEPIEDTGNTWTIDQTTPGVEDYPEERTIQTSDGMRVMVRYKLPEAPPPAPEDKTVKELQGKVCQLETTVAKLATRIDELETKKPAPADPPPDDGPAIRIIVDEPKTKDNEGKPIIRIKGAEMTLEQLTGAIEKAVDGQVRARAGIVS